MISIILSAATLNSSLPPREQSRRYLLLPGCRRRRLHPVPEHLRSGQAPCPARPRGLQFPLAAQDWPWADAPFSRVKSRLFIKWASSAARHPGTMLYDDGIHRRCDLPTHRKQHHTNLARTIVLWAAAPQPFPSPASLPSLPGIFRKPRCTFVENV
jgi:hypothetical protein